MTKKGGGVGAVLVLINELKLAEDTNAEGRFVFQKIPLGTYTVVLTLGDDTAVHTLLVAEAGTMTVNYEVDWVTRGYEEVTVIAEELAAKVVDAPAAVTSIPVQQIEQQASQGQVPKILEFTPGAEITQSGLYDFNFNTRGFNSSLNRRVSTYIDGRDVGVVLLGAQEWAAISGGLDDVASLEFIRGPSAALYGANASSGVVNITTKAPKSSLGSLVRTTVGELNTVNVDFRGAYALGRDWYVKAIGGYKRSDDFTVSRDPDGPDRTPGTLDDLREPEYATFCSLVGEKDCLLPERPPQRTNDEIGYGGIRFDKYLTDTSVLSFEAGGSAVKGPVFQTGIGRVQNVSSERPFVRTSWSNLHWNVLGHFTWRDGHQVNLTKALVVDYDLDTQDKRYGTEAQGHWSFLDDRIRWVIGGAFTKEGVDSKSRATGIQTVVFRPEHSNREAVFTQFDYKANEHFKLVFAAREDWSTLHDPQFSPKAAVVYSVNSSNSIRLTYNRAFQVANYSEFFLHARIASFPIGGFVRTICGARGMDCGISGDFVPILAVGNHDLKLEKTEAWELGYSGVIASKAYLTVDYYRAKNKDFITDLVPQVGTILGNLSGCVDKAGTCGGDGTTTCYADAQCPGGQTCVHAPASDPTQCPINNDYGPWVGPAEAETTLLVPAIGLTVAQALRNAVDNSVGGNTLGFRLAKDLNGDTVVVGRTYTNFGLVNTQGVDLGLQYFFLPELSVQANYSWFDFKVVDAGVALGKVGNLLLPNTPEHKASLGVAFNRKTWGVNAAGRWVQGFRWSTGVYDGDVPSYLTVDLGANWRINDLVRLGLNVANAANNVHRETFGGDQLKRRALLNASFTW